VIVGRSSIPVSSVETQAAEQGSVSVAVQVSTGQAMMDVEKKASIGPWRWRLLAARAGRAPSLAGGPSLRSTSLALHLSASFRIFLSSHVEAEPRRANDHAFGCDRVPCSALTVPCPARRQAAGWALHKSSASRVHARAPSYSLSCLHAQSLLCSRSVRSHASSARQQRRTRRRSRSLIRTRSSTITAAGTLPPRHGGSSPRLARVCSQLRALQGVIRAQVTRRGPQVPCAHPRSEHDSACAQHQRLGRLRPVRLVQCVHRQE
jgi:hypothetical protein